MKRIMTIVVLLAAASVSPLIFPLAESGRSTMDTLAKLSLLPSIAVIGIVWGFLYRRDDPLARPVAVGLAAGAVATIALEAVRLPGFWLGFMPGNLPRLMGVLLLNQFATGPTLASDIAGWAYHFWNGATFGLIYVLVFRTCRRWLGMVYGVLLGFGFMFSPVVSALGVGFLGLEFSKGFPVTVTLAHAAFGGVLGWLTARLLGFETSARYG
jgi:tryptophan-rich sensory protein